MIVIALIKVVLWKPGTKKVTKTPTTLAYQTLHWTGLQSQTVDTHKCFPPTYLIVIVMVLNP